MRRVGAWYKSSHSDAKCVQVQLHANGDVSVRDDKDPDGPVLKFSRAEWAAFIAGVHGGEFEPMPAPGNGSLAPAPVPV